ncbi:endonuclease/exonuclease/phosphatase family protein [Nonomuraea cavernae]|uniref:endonuclease/exonuclease/phosphatase family protein n=1 Tax=Nonomuraea cavernae TaxID=2045107 RepID=UPI0033E57AFC
MRLAAWNVNSVKARLPRLVDWLAGVRPDVVCLQETKCAAEGFPRRGVDQVGEGQTSRPCHCRTAARWSGRPIATRLER